MTYTEFVRLVYDMRCAQKDYFERRTRSALVLAKDLEQRVDRQVLQVIGDAIVAEQGELFPSVDGRQSTVDGMEQL